MELNARTQKKQDGSNGSLVHAVALQPLQRAWRDPLAQRKLLYGVALVPQAMIEDADALDAQPLDGQEQTLSDHTPQCGRSCQEAWNLVRKAVRPMCVLQQIDDEGSTGTDLAAQLLIAKQPAQERCRDHVAECPS